jgi:Flp pilus assembly protein TadG
MTGPDHYDRGRVPASPRPLWLSTRTRWWRGDDGAASAFVVVLTAGILVLAGLALDGGLALAAKVRASGQAEAAARAGAQAIDLTVYRGAGTLRLVPTQAVTYAQAHLAAEGATGTVTVSDDTVTVTVTASYTTQVLGLVGIGPLQVRGRGSAYPRHGVTAIDP